MALKIEYLRVSEIREYKKNARTHSPDQIAQIIDSINEFGFTNPVLVDENNELIAGHGRTQAAKAMGLKEVPAIRLVNLSDAQKRALRIADNQLALNAGWDLELLAQELQDLELDGFNLDILGFDSEYLSNLLDGEVGGDNDESELDDENIYTRKVTVPIYEPTGEKPDVTELYDTERYDAIIGAIEANKDKLPSEVAKFLTLAAGRHVKVNYQKVAEFYAHTKDETIRELFRDSALVIIDFDAAIEKGYVQLTKSLMELSGEDAENA